MQPILSHKTTIPPIIPPISDITKNDLLFLKTQQTSKIFQESFPYQAPPKTPNTLDTTCLKTCFKKPRIGDEVTRLSTSNAVVPPACDRADSSLSLEQNLKEIAFPQNLDVYENIGFPDFLQPNEGEVQELAPHLKKGMDAADGILVSTGTERSFFSLAQCDPSKCKGLVVVDINPRVKAYVDFNVLLLRLSSNREEYAVLSDPTDYNSQRISLIKEKLDQSDLPEVVKNYYSSNFQNFASIYFSHGRWRKLKDFYRIKNFLLYWQEDSYFQVLQEYAKSGNIIAKIGCISDLQFLKQRVSIVNISNILDYSFLFFKFDKNTQSPLIIWTDLHYQKTDYYSCFPNSLNNQEEEELRQLITTITNEYFLSGILRTLPKEILGCNRQILNYLRLYSIRYNTWSNCGNIFKEIHPMSYANLKGI